MSLGMLKKQKILDGAFIGICLLPKVHMKSQSALSRILKILASLRVTVACLLILALLTVMGTLYQVDHGLYAAKLRFFGAWVVMFFGWLPFPGVNTTIAALAVNLLASALVKMDRRLKQSGVILVHLGILVLICGAAAIHYGTQESVLTLGEGEFSSSAAILRNSTLVGYRELPVTVRLLAFTKKTHPGTSIASSFESTVHVSGTGIDRDAVISMNRPLRYKNLTFYQSGYSESPQGETTTIAVVENSGRVLPYLATLIMTAGFLVHFMGMLIKVTKTQRTRMGGSL